MRQMVLGGNITYFLYNVSYNLQIIKIVYNKKHNAQKISSVSCSKFGFAS